MIPDLSGISTIKTEKSVNSKVLMEESYKTDHEWKIVWRNVVIFLYVHLGALYGVYMLCSQAKWLSFVWICGFILAGGLGITAGAHRLWAHRSYKAKWPMRFILMIFQTIAFQDDIYQWARDHRVHHKFTDTDADPYNARRGFFFSHIGWLMVRKHPDVAMKGALVDCSDLKQDPFVVFQKKWYKYWVLLCSIIIPTLVPWWAWNESLWCSLHLTILRSCLTLNGTWSVNSVAHIWGMKPYDKSLSSRNNAGVSFVTFGEGSHNYHHVFPWDYKASELGGSFTTNFINFFAKIGWAYDLKEPSEDLVKMVAMKKGDGSFQLWDAVPHPASKIE